MALSARERAAFDAIVAQLESEDRILGPRARRWLARACIVVGVAALLSAPFSVLLIGGGPAPIAAALLALIVGGIAGYLLGRSRILPGRARRRGTRPAPPEEVTGSSC